ncbi:MULTISPECIES: DUF7504 family protein [Halomicrobium]|uniref:Recombinase RecA n=2 Tax=Halomicrobium mukohataei TaxID=57705 RepID=C7P373_HALMD|nr:MULTISPECIES: hypothetical protein [Halomicrobium]ACV47545.1 conserved hypothetical protein [Halomicrobium mukohataei DSM 12286]
MSQVKARYGFEGVPLEPVPAGTNLLVTGPSLGGLRQLSLSLLSGPADEGVLLVTADVSASEVVADFEAVGGDADPGKMCLVDCTHESDGTESDRVHGVATPADLTGIGMSLSALYEQLYDDGLQRVRVGVYTLGPLLVYADDVRPVYRFLHTVAGRVRAADGLGVCAVDPAAHDERTIRSVAQAFDGRVELREGDAGHQLRVRGLSGQPGGWLDVTL